MEQSVGLKQSPSSEDTQEQTRDLDQVPRNIVFECSKGVDQDGSVNSDFFLIDPEKSNSPAFLEMPG